MKLRTQILLFFFLFALVPLVTAVLINLPLVLERMELFYHKAHLQNLRADFRDLDQHLASRDEMVKLLAKLPEPGTMLGDTEDAVPEAIDQARTRYIQWINQILFDQRDIVQIVFFDRRGLERFWLDRDIESLEWQPTTERPPRVPDDFLQAALKLEPGRTLVSPISLDPEAGARDPRRFMTLRLISPLGQNSGAVLISIDVGGMARSYRNTLWVHDNGTFLEHAGPGALSGSAFEHFSGLNQVFTKGTPGLWEGSQGEQIMWVPLFRTEQQEALWVGRQVDPSPIASFRNALTLRVLSIVFALIVIVWFAARWIAKRADRLGRELTKGIQHTLETEEPVSFSWRGPQELRILGENLTRLSEEHRRNTLNLKNHAKELEESNRYKSEFLANVSHELRTPLNSILLLSKMLSDSKSGLNPDQLKQAKVINEAGSDLQALIDNILDLSRIEARRTSFNIELIDVAELMQDLIGLVLPQFEHKGLWLKLECDDDAPARITSDRDKVAQIIKNFLSNAVKFTTDGGITLRIRREIRSDACDCDLRISVTDSGIGIPAEKHDHIFEAFKQADGATNRRYGGTGLGLTISQQLAHLLGGHIELDSRENEGSTFSLLLPLQFDPQRVDAEHVTHHDLEDEPGMAALKPQQQTPPQAEELFTGHNILVVDNDVQNLLALTPLLEKWGMEVTAAGDGGEAMEALEEEHFSLVLIDVMMPGLNGYDTIRRIRAGHRTDHLSVIALTAETGSSEREACIEAGADDFVSKPLDPEELRETIARHLPDDPSSDLK